MVSFIFRKYAERWAFEFAGEAHHPKITGGDNKKAASLFQA